MVLKSDDLFGLLWLLHVSEFTFQLGGFFSVLFLNVIRLKPQCYALLNYFIFTEDAQGKLTTVVYTNPTEMVKRITGSEHFSFEDKSR